MESPEHSPEQLSAEQAAQDLDEEESLPADTDETEMTGPVDEELEDRGDV